MECEGFICPYCLVGFGTSGKLQNHFIDMHSGQGLIDDYDVVEYVEEEPKPIDRSSPLGHQFKVIRQSRPKTCDSCSEIIWQDGLVCQVCQVTIHVDNCLGNLTTKCSSDEVFDSPPTELEVRPGPGQNPKGLLPLVRRQVAKGKDRYVNDEFDLDLTYITERIIAMSFPATGVESAYRNNLKDVAKMLKTKHQDNYMVFNLSERSYDISRFNNQVLDFGWPDHLAPSLERLSSVCKSIRSWLDSDPLHVAVVHCKGGKGRTGCVIAAFMHYSEICHSAAAALDRFAMKRFYDNKLGGVTQPSQRKYVHYFADLLAGKIDLHDPPVVLQHVLLHGIPNFDGKGGCRVFLKIYENMKLVHTSGLYVCTAEKERLKISIYGGLKLQGEILLKCFHKKTHSGMDSIFRCQFPSPLVKDDLRLVYAKADLDDAFKDKRFQEDIKVELLFCMADQTDSNARGSIADVRSSLLNNKLQPPQTNGSTDLSHDIMANRDSYIAFPGGFDNGIPGGEDVPDLMSHETPELDRKERTESSTSFKMDPKDIERVHHRTEIYTVISKPFKKSERDPELKPYKSVDALDTSSHGSKLPGIKINQPPSRPPPPKMQRSITSPICYSKPITRAPPPSVPPPEPPTLSPNQSDYAEYAELNDPSPSSSEGNSPLHRPGGGVPLVIKQSNLNKRTEHSDRIQLDVLGSSQPLRPNLPSQSSDVLRENKKLILHQKYSKIREELMKKQGLVDEADKDDVKKKERPKPPQGHKIRSRPSYDEVEPDLEIRVEPLSLGNQREEDDFWVKVKYPTIPRNEENIGRRSTSSSNLTSSDYYSNLAELQLDAQVASEGSGSDSMGRRRHSFSEGDDKLIIRATSVNRESIIAIANRSLSNNGLDSVEPPSSNPDYKNLQYNPDGSLSMEPESSSFRDQIKMLRSAVGGSAPPRNYENTRFQYGNERSDMHYDDDYMNDTAEGINHTYSNQEELLMQMQADNIPLPDEAEKILPLEPSQRLRLGSGTSILKFLKNNILKPKQPTEIHSGSISEVERDKTLAPFAISGVSVGRVNRDYEAFFKTSAWEKSVSNTANSPTSNEPPRSLASPPNGVMSSNVSSAAMSVSQGERSEQQCNSRGDQKPDKPVRPLLPYMKLRNKTNEDASDQKDNRVRISPHQSPPSHRKLGPNAPVKRTPLLPPTAALQRQHTERGSNLHSPATSNKPAQMPLPNTSSPPLVSNQYPSPPSSHPPLLPTSSNHLPRPVLRTHAKLQASSSDAPALPKPRQRDSDRSQSIDPPNVMVRTKRVPPPLPLPFQPVHSSSDSPPTESQVRSLMLYWYKPKITREEAIELVLRMSTGFFIVRDSSTVKGGYALTLKINEAIVRQRKKMTPEEKVTDDMKVTHFLVQPDPVGVKLQGWSEKPFKSLPAFIASHVIDKMCLPCKLVLPELPSQVTRRQAAGIAKAMQSGAACDLIYVGSVDVANSGSDSLLSQTVQQLQSLDLSAMNIVTITVSREGITLQENFNGSNLKRQYPYNLITYCGLDASTRWNFPSLHHMGETVLLTNKICFGIVHRPLNSFGFSCMVFAEYDCTQPVSSVVNFIQKMMREHKHSSKFN